MPWLSIGVLLAATAVAAGAFGAHGLEEKLDQRSLGLWETGARYLMYGGLALALLGAVARQGSSSGLVGAAGWSLLAGVVVFSGTLAGLALGGARWLGAVTPLGGVLMIVGLVLFAVAAWR